MMTLRDRPIPRGRVALLAASAALLGIMACETPRPIGPEPVEEISEEAPLMIAPTVFFTDSQEELDTGGEDVVRLRLLDEGRIRVAAEDRAPQTVRLDDLAEVWHALSDSNPDRTAVVEVDPSMSIGRVSETMAALQSAGARRVAIREMVLEQPMQQPLGLPDDSGPPAVLEMVVRNSPLVIVDGVRVENGVMDQLLNRISPSDIERISVVKGAPAIEAYGSDGLAGVIFIRTKSGPTAGG